MLNPKLLIHFQAAARRGNLRKAAEDLGISQPALTKSILNLESRLGVKLMRRSTRGISANRIGKALATHGEAIAAELLAVEATLKHMTGGSQRFIRFGAGPTFCDWLVPAAIHRFKKNIPNARIWTMVGVKDELIHALRNGSIDFFLSQPFEAEQHGLDFEILYSDRLAVCARPGHPLAKEAHAEVAELAGFEWALIRDQMSGAAEDQLMKVFLENGMPPPKVTLESDSAPLVYATIANTDLLCLRPVPVGQMHTRIGGLVEIATPPIFPRLTRGLTYRNPSGLDSTATAMVRVIKEVSTGFSGDRPTDTAGSLPA